MNISIRLEEERDYRHVETLTREAFWDLYRPGCVEHWILHQIRNTPVFVKALSFVACAGDTVIGNIVYSRAKVVSTDNQAFEVLCMGPFAVAPSFQKKGVGARLIQYSIEKAKGSGFKAVVIYGDPDYYRRFGFVRAAEHGITTSSGESFDAFMALELFAGALDGVRGRFYADPVFEKTSGKAFEAFEKEFPHKEKHVTDTQFFH